MAQLNIRSQFNLSNESREPEVTPRPKYSEKGLTSKTLGT